MSVEVKAQNTISMTSVKAIKDATDEANTLLDSMRQSAEDAGTTLNGIYQDAEDAKTNASNALASAQSASEYASRALGNLSTVQSVTETLNWITAHGTMTLTQDVALDPSHVYFVADQNGDYVVGGQHYAVVSEPDVADISTYYELSIDESLNNYVATHLVVDSEGLWIIPDAGGNKVLIATGQGSTYTSAGTYIVGKVNNVDTVLAQFTSDGVIIGQTGESHIEMDYHSMQLVDKEANAYFYVSDLRDKNDNYQATITETFRGDGTSTGFSVQLPVSAEVSATDSSHSSNPVTRNSKRYTFTTAPDEGAKITIIYKTTSESAKAYTFGMRATGVVGAMSVAEGGDTIASGARSHAEGWLTTASGLNSHAEGYYTRASGAYSHAEGADTTASGEYSHAEGVYTTASGDTSHAEGQSTTASGDFSHAEGRSTTASGAYSHASGRGTTANEEHQTVIGKYNDNQTNTAFEIGNGTYSAHSNAFTVDWSGNVEANDMLIDLPNYQTTGDTDKAIYDACVALGWDSDVLIN